MALIFFNIGWMNKYNGIAGDSIERGGKYNQHSVGHEVCNFTNNNGTLYGYVQPVGESIKIEKLGASKQDDRIDGVTVVWTAGPESGGTVVVGWYREATVYRNIQRIEKPNKLQKENGVTGFRVSALAEKAVLLPVEQRDLIIPRAVKGGIGQSNVWFAESKESRHLVEQVTALINGKIQYRRIAFNKGKKEDEDVRNSNPADYYASPELVAEMEGRTYIPKNKAL